jgi:hypothetical protein
MSDPGHFEINSMQRGTTVYKFGGNAKSYRGRHSPTAKWSWTA